MSTMPNYKVTGTDWVDLYTTLSIATGASVKLQNLGVNSVIIHEAPSKPSASVSDGFVLRSASNGPDSTAIITHKSGDIVFVKTANPNLQSVISVYVLHSTSGGGGN